MTRPGSSALAFALAAAVAGCGTSNPGAAVATSTGHLGVTTATPATAVPSVPSGTAAAVPAHNSAPCPQAAPAASGVRPLQDILFVSPQAGWAVGAVGILATTDAGAHWRPQLSVDAGLRQVDAVDALHAWTVGARSLLATSDAGACWRPVGEPPSPLAQVHFVSATTGWGITVASGLPVTGGGDLEVTRDAGASWSAVPAVGGRQLGLCFGDRNHGTVVDATGTVRTTTDGGGTWTTVLDPSMVGPVRGATVQCSAAGAVWMEVEGLGAATSNAPYNVWHFTGGTTWDRVVENRFTDSVHPPQAPQGPGSYPGPISAVDGHTCALVGNTPPAEQPVHLMVAGSGGLTVSLPVPALVDAGGAAFLTARQGWVVGTGAGGAGLVEMTVDGGHTWNSQFHT